MQSPSVVLNMLSVLFAFLLIRKIHHLMILSKAKILFKSELVKNHHIIDRLEKIFARKPIDQDNVIVVVNIIREVISTFPENQKRAFEKDLFNKVGIQQVENVRGLIEGAVKINKRKEKRIEELENIIGN